MRIHLHDFSGHPFQIQLARDLARRGHDVLYSYCPQYVTGRGRVEPDDGLPTLRIAAIIVDRELDKYSPRKRIAWELAYARAWCDAFDPQTDVAIICNVPLLAHARIHRFLRKSGVPTVLWHQDIYSLAMGDEATRKLRALGRPLSWAFERIERNIVKTSTAVVAIGDQFVVQYKAWGLNPDNAVVIPNWAPLDDIIPAERSNIWSEANGLTGDALRLMYTGTLGRKHNPHLLVDLVDKARDRGLDAELVVVSEGVGADEIKAAKRSHIRVLPFQPAEALPDVMGAADVLVAILEPEASGFSVPSKILSYLAAGRPILALTPGDNQCATDVRAGGGCVAAPTPTGVIDGLGWLEQIANSPEQRAEIGRVARSYAEAKFEIKQISDRFEAVIIRAADGRKVQAIRS